jgi:nucleoside-diphosphate-sugar epimerase
MAGDLKNVRGEYIFFAAYLAQDKEEDAWEVNGRMLSNFLCALEKTGAMSQVKRIILVCGAKQYGVHLGLPKLPMHEDAPWLTSSSKWPPNFYYNQQNILHEFCTKHQKEWVVTYPNDVIGFATGNFMNLSSALALYVLVSKEMSGSGGIEFPGSPAFYTKFDSFTNAKLHAEFCAWAALEPRAANQAFNVVNGDVESWQNLWPKVTKYFGTSVKPDQFKSAYSRNNASISDRLKGMVVGTDDQSSSMDMAPQPPISEEADPIGLQGTPVLEPNRVEQHIDLVKWSQREDVKQAWNALAEREGLAKDAFDKATWAFLGFVLGRNFDLVISMSKARECGWTGYRDTWDSLKTVFEQMRAAYVLPKA